MIVLLAAFASLSAAFTLNYATRVPIADANLAAWKCTVAFLPYNASDPTSDPTPYSGLVTDKNMARNSECAGVCGTKDAAVNENAGKSAPADSYFCAKDADGNCARALSFGLLAASASKCELTTTSGSVNVEVTVDTYNATAAYFGVGARRSYTSSYTCANAMADTCTIVSACGSFHVASNKKPADSKCDANCVATGDACSLYVCAKEGATCYVYDRILSMPTQPSSCTWRGPTACETPPQPADPFVYMPTPKAGDKTVFCCGSPASATTSTSSAAAAGSPTTGAVGATTGAVGATTTEAVAMTKTATASTSALTATAALAAAFVVAL